ncbi:MAG: biopolymer transporter TolR [Verrucomicrobia bacterium]|nr:biopolymer transporter TolR [Verrucomicrobiota bacterium]
MSALLSSGVSPVLSQDNPLGQFDGCGDVGSPKIAGHARYDAARQAYHLSGSGTNMWFGADEFHFLWKRMKGDFILRARLQFMGKGVDPHRKAGWMVRPSLEPDAPYADCAEHGDGLTSLQFRPAPGADTGQVVLAITNANILQLERKGGTYIFSAAREGDPFVAGQVTNLTLGEEVYVGLYVCSHNGDAVEEARFDNVRIIRPVKQGFIPYQDYIGSQLEILDVHRGDLQILHVSSQPFEAPNWMPDGKALIYNISGRAEGWGRLMRFDLRTRTSTLIPTDFAIKNNNDHVLSFDGTMLGISDQSAGAGESTIYTLPVGGGTPKRITPLTPSYLHGWSPDGRWLVYTGGRGNKYDIYRIPSDGSGPERRLTDSPGLNDGPEYSPDDKSIYFNSSRTGKMQIWRMNPDGTGAEQVTHDEFNNWFPHLSPDGKWIAFISFPEDIDPDDHPYYKQVYLRLMPRDGGSARVIAYVYGGQGTMNVPSWSPDSQRIAFVSNTDL